MFWHAAAGASPPIHVRPSTIGLEKLCGGWPTPGRHQCREARADCSLRCQSGRVLIRDGTSLLPEPFLDITAMVTPDRANGERGLLGITFHPQYLSNGFFYVNYTDSVGDTVIARYHVSTDPTVPIRTAFGPDPDNRCPTVCQSQRRATAIRTGRLIFTLRQATADRRRPAGQRPEFKHAARQNPAHRRRFGPALRRACRQPFQCDPRCPSRNLGLGPEKSLAFQFRSIDR